MKKGNQWAKKKVHRDMRWFRGGNYFYVQLVDNKVITLLSTVDCSNNFAEVHRKMKVNQKWEKITVKKPNDIDRYNLYVGTLLTNRTKCSPSTILFGKVIDGGRHFSII